MKRIDLHLHTISSPLDKEFEFSLDVLVERVERNHLDAIALTNHNLFDLDNYWEVREALSSEICVLPGIEVSVESYHVIVIADPDQIDSFARVCSNIPAIQQNDVGMSDERFLNLFGDGSYLIIPHYKKRPAIPSSSLAKLESAVAALEVSSDKKWYIENKRSCKPVVLFGDFRCEKGAVAPWGRYTYVNIGEVSFDSLRLAFRDKSKFSISEREGHFELAPGLFVSSRLNVVVGGRSSGKTYLLDRINESCDPDDVVYVRQFDIVKDAEEKSFKEKLHTEENSIKADYYEPMTTVSSAVMDLPSKEETTKSIKDYRDDLVQYADSVARDDEYSKCPIYSAGKIAVEDSRSEEEVVKAIVTLLKDNPLSADIEKVIGRAALTSLLRIAIARYKTKALRCKCIKLANKIAMKVKGSLATESSRPACPTSPMVEVARRIAYVERLALLRGATKDEAMVSARRIGKFKRIVKRVPYRDATSLKAALGTTTSLAGSLQLEDIEFVERVLAVKGVSDISKAFFDMTVNLENEHAEEVSGGQKAEYLFFQALDKAATHDVVLIDEPESSFDNPFLNELIASELKKLSAKSTVFIATHNNVLGVSIKPDGIVFTSYEDGVHRVYACDSTDTLMRSPDGRTVQRSAVLLQLMEAGDKAYKGRRPYYGLAND